MQAGLGGLPVTGFAAVGWGAVLTLQTTPRSQRQDFLCLLNLIIYGSLTCLAIAAQSAAVVHEALGQVSMRMLCDHAAGIVLICGLAVQVISRLRQPLPEKR